MGVLASWSSKYMELSKICFRTELSRPTINSYINLLELLYLFEEVRPWLNTDYDRIGRSCKIFTIDTGLMSSILGWKQDEVLNGVEVADTDRAGKLMETFVFSELAAQIDLDSSYSLYQYRDKDKREIDFLIERNDGALVGIDLKAGRSVSGSDFAPQIWFKKNMVKNKKRYFGLVLYSGEDVLSFGNGLLAVPIASLWSE